MKKEKKIGKFYGEKRQPNYIHFEGFICTLLTWFSDRIFGLMAKEENKKHKIKPKLLEFDPFSFAKNSSFFVVICSRKRNKTFLMCKRFNYQYFSFRDGEKYVNRVTVSQISLVVNNFSRLILRRCECVCVVLCLIHLTFWLMLACLPQDHREFNSCFSWVPSFHLLSRHMINSI